MKPLLIHIIVLILSLLFTHIYAQDASTAPERTPEQEAAKQTERLQEELSLTPEQVQKVREINLKYAQQRQHSNTRSDAVKRIKNKDEDLRKILSREQYEHLQTKRYERSAAGSAENQQRRYAQPENHQTKPAERGNVSTERRTTRAQTTEARTQQTQREAQTSQMRQANSATQQRENVRVSNQTRQTERTAPRTQEATRQTPPSTQTTAPTRQTQPSASQPRTSQPTRSIPTQQNRR